MDVTKAATLQEAVWEYYAAHGRHDLPWRLSEADGTFDPYKILVSEIMLQQTQVSRAIPKYLAFLEQFPTFEALAAATLAKVLTAWSGLGYNRRAKFLHQAAGVVMHQYAGQLPQSQAELVALPGIGANTAGAIRAYAFNQSAVYVETNIRTVFFKHCFEGQTEVSDASILQAVQQTLPQNGEYREWYWALMDYGSYLKQTHALNAQSRTYSKQSVFAGSRRQLRGKVLKSLLAGPKSYEALAFELTDERLKEVLKQLEAEGMLQHKDKTYRL